MLPSRQMTSLSKVSMRQGWRWSSSSGAALSHSSLPSLWALFPIIPFILQYPENHDEDFFPHSANVDPSLEDVFKRNREWVAMKKEQDPEFFKRLGRGQTPAYLYIGCSDSRVPANEIMGLPPGEVFVHRNVGNLIVASDLNFLSVLQYAVEVLQVKHIIVTGHYDCGAVRAAMESKDFGLIENWLRNIRDVYRTHQHELDAIENKEARHRRLVEFVVMEQCINIFKTGVVQKRRQETYKAILPGSEHKIAYPRIHGLVFDPAEGILRPLPIDYKVLIRKLANIYNLYPEDVVVDKRA